MPDTRAEVFRALHHGRRPDHPLVLPGPWDAAAARAFADAGFPALATPSAGVAASLGYADGSVPAPEMFAAVARIVRAAGVPVSADLEGGYGLPPRELVARIAETGAVGCNLEDGDGATGTLEDPRRHADWLAEVCAEAGGALFVNARVDTYLRGITDPDEAVARIVLYEAAGVDGVYPIMAPPEHLPVLAAATALPVNVHAAATAPPVAELGRLGARRITFGPGLQRRAQKAVEEMARDLLLAAVEPARTTRAVEEARGAA
ncbi:isocitrate lyase/phosphoenolpyruvate mutase family protein [Streptomyces sp. t39]|uniref:isocitrate lyase/PEP mutase family protein n=1 Tax=Streptomyces sp. t39 TaxID=1828156 RepID=UPI0011CE79D3|nr:isocitrate lyase/phosphoenolpyruvate mutase family protein [Streptomyces sp. t39]TXS56539.1 isocitrate lyase/phosphoenolpyruvate mutase family protein [Streptomyces sp. t39]